MEIGMCSNPYNYHLPVDPSRFVGRWNEVEMVVKRLGNPTGDSFIIVAGRRCGKSSFLEVVSDRLDVIQNTSSFRYRSLPVLLDLKSKEFDSPGRIFSQLLHCLLSRVDVNQEWRISKAWGNLVDLDAPWFRNLSDKPSLELDEFEKGISYILKSLDQASPENLPVRLILLLDEMDEILNLPWTEKLLNQMRSLVYSGSQRERVRWVLAGSHHLLEDVIFRGSTLWGMLEKLYLVPFDQKGCNDLMKPAVDLSPEMKENLILQTGGHPFLAQYLLYHLWENGIKTSTQYDVDRLIDRFYAQEIGTLNGWVSALGSQALRIYRLIANAGKPIDEIDILRAFEGPGDQVKNCLIALTCHGLVINESWKRYDQRCEIFKGWLDRRGI